MVVERSYPYVHASRRRKKRWRQRWNGRCSSRGLFVWTSISRRITHVLAAAHPSWALQRAANRWNPLILATRSTDQSDSSVLSARVSSASWARRCYHFRGQRRKRVKDGRTKRMRRLFALSLSLSLSLSLVIDPNACTILWESTPPSGHRRGILSSTDWADGVSKRKSMSSK